MSDNVNSNPAPAQDTISEGVDTSNHESVADIAKQAEQAVKRYKVKVDNQEIEVDEAELLRGYSHQSAANKRFQEGQLAKQQVEQLINMMKDPDQFWQVAEKIGHKNTRELAEKLLIKQLQEEQMDPRDKELRDAKARLKEIEDLDRQQKEALEAKRLEEVKAHYMKEYEESFISALKSENLPATKGTVAEMAKYISRAAKLNYKLTAQQAAKLVAEDIQTAHRNLIGVSDAETLLKLLGDDVANKIRQHDLKKLKNPNNFNNAIEKEPRESKPRAKKKDSGPSYKDWRKNKF